MQTAETSEKTNEPTERSREVFIVHGHDTLAKAEVARFIEHAGLTAVILHDFLTRDKRSLKSLSDTAGQRGSQSYCLHPMMWEAPTKITSETVPVKT